VSFQQNSAFRIIPSRIVKQFLFHSFPFVAVKFAQMPAKRKLCQIRQAREMVKDSNKRLKRNNKQKKQTDKMADDNFVFKIAGNQKNGFRTLPITLLSGFLVCLAYVRLVNMYTKWNRALARLLFSNTYSIPRITVFALLL